MKFDIEIARDLLQRVEDRPPLQGMEIYEMPDPPKADDHIVLEHIQLLIEAGLIQGKILSDDDAIPSHAFVERLTMAGHEFLANSRENKAWEAVKEGSAKAGGRITIGVAIAIMQAVILRQLGLK